MPIYTYKCHQCSNLQDELHKVAELNTYQFECEKCGCTGGERQISAPAMVYHNADANFFLGGSLTKLDTLNGKPKKKKVISNQYRNTTPE